MNPMRLPFVAVSILAALSARADEVLRVSGTGTALGSMRSLAEAFEKANPGHRVRILASVGTSGAMKAVADGALDVGLSGRALRPEERSLGLVAVEYARTPFVFAVGPRAGVTGITAADLARIYRGELPYWPNGERIRLVLRPRSDVDSEIVAGISPNMRAAVDVALRREGLLMAATNQECNELLSRTPGSIGPTSLTQILAEGRPLVALSWEGVAPTLANLASGKYPLGKSLSVVFRRSPPPRVRRFVAFLSSPAAVKMLERTGNLAVPPPPRE